jgi:hypothetical protein
LQKIWHFHNIENESKSFVSYEMKCWFFGVNKCLNQTCSLFLSVKHYFLTYETKLIQFRNIEPKVSCVQKWKYFGIFKGVEALKRPKKQNSNLSVHFGPFLRWIPTNKNIFVHNVNPNNVCLNDLNWFLPLMESFNHILFINDCGYASYKYSFLLDTNQLE